MSYKLFLARALATRNRTERRTLRDHVRQQLGQLRHDEKRICGLQLSVAWTQPRRTESQDSVSVKDWTHAAQPAV